MQISSNVPELLIVAGIFFWIYGRDLLSGWQIGIAMVLLVFVGFNYFVNNIRKKVEKKNDKLIN